MEFTSEFFAYMASFGVVHQQYRCNGMSQQRAVKDTGCKEEREVEKYLHRHLFPSAHQVWSCPGTTVVQHVKC